MAALLTSAALYCVDAFPFFMAAVSISEGDARAIAVPYGRVVPPVLLCVIHSEAVRRYPALVNKEGFSFRAANLHSFFHPQSLFPGSVAIAVHGIHYSVC